MTIDTTVKKSGSTAGRGELVASGLMEAVFCFMVGVLLLVVPVIGWILGPALMLLAALIIVVHGAALLTRRSGYVGRCPHCGAKTTVHSEDGTGRCPVCRRRVALHDGELEIVEDFSVT